MGGVCGTEMAVVSPNKKNETSHTGPKGVSVHWLKYGLLREVREAGFDEKSTVYQIENLNERRHGIIRQKGAHHRCPRDGKIGAAYVDCLHELEYAGPADTMLSYGWGNTIGDIVHTLWDYCKTNELNPKYTYIWICCLCNNQHRIFDQRQHGNTTAVDDFLDSCEEYVPSVKRVVSIMSPWDKPLCLSRAWCIFELNNAIQSGKCELTIAMPPKEREKMIESHNDFNKLLDTISNTKIEEAQVSVGDDKSRILAIIQESRVLDISHKLSPVTKLNNRVKKFLLEHVKDYARGEIYRYERENDDISDDIQFADLCKKIGYIMRISGRHDDAIFLYRRALKVREMFGGYQDRASARLYTDIGDTMMDNTPEYDSALVEYQNAVETYEDVLGGKHPDTAAAYCKIGSVLDSKGDYEEALLQYRKANTIYEKVLGKLHPHTATMHNNIGLTMDSNGDYDNALVEFRKALLIEELVYGKGHPTTAATYNNIGGALYAKGDRDAALEEFKKAHAINIETLEEDNAFRNIPSKWIAKIENEKKMASPLTIPIKWIMDERKNDMPWTNGLRNLFK